jgi:hypothetical protein
MNLREWWAYRQPHFRCPRCGWISFNPNDIAHLYCGRCHLYFAPPEIWPLPRNEPSRPLVEAAPKHREEARQDDSPAFPIFPTWDPPAAPEPGGGSSGGGGASGDW